MTALSYTFPNDFIWGAATAAHQIEGNNVSSDWWAREHSPNTDLSEASNDACDSYNRFEEDIRLLGGLRAADVPVQHRMGAHRTGMRLLLQGAAAALPAA